jgi:chorismate synthase
VRDRRRCVIVDEFSSKLAEPEKVHEIPGIGCVIDGCPPGLALAPEEFRRDLDRRASGKSRYTSQRHETDEVEILSGVFEGRSTGTPIALLIRNVDARSKDYAEIAQTFRPGHADYTYWQKYGIRDPRGGGRSSARETTMRVAAGVVAKNICWKNSASPCAAGWRSLARSRRESSTGRRSMPIRSSGRTPRWFPSWRATSMRCASRATRSVRA